MNRKDMIGGLGLVGFAGAYAMAAGQLSMTSSLGIGSGLFPMLLAGILAILGLFVAAQAYAASPEGEEASPPVPLRGILLVTLAPIAFALLVVPLGVVPALGLAVFLSALASRTTSFPAAVAITVFIVLFCVALFRWGLGLPLALFGPSFPFGS